MSEYVIQRFESEFDSDGDLEKAYIKVENDDRLCSMRLERADDELVIKHFSERDAKVFRRETFEAFWRCIEELHARDIRPDLGPFVLPPRLRTGDAIDQPSSVSVDGLVADGAASVSPVVVELGYDDAPTPTPLDDDLDPVLERAPETVTAVETEQWCGICGEGPFSNLKIHHGRLHPAEKMQASTVPPVGDDSAEADAESPNWLADDPHTLIEESPIPRTLDQFVGAIRESEHVRQLMHRSAATNADQVRELLQQLGLLDGNGEIADGDVFRQRLAELEEVAADA